MLCGGGSSQNQGTRQMYRLLSGRYQRSGARQRVYKMQVWWPRSFGECFSCQLLVLGETHWNGPPWPGTTVTICMSYFMRGGPGKEHRSNKPPPTGRIWERSKEMPRILSLSRLLLNALHLGWAMRVPPGIPWVRMARNNPETNPITIKPKIASHVAEQFSQVPLP